MIHGNHVFCAGGYGRGMGVIKLTAGKDTISAEEVWFRSAPLQAWYDGVTAAGYVPVYYGDTTAGSAFAKGWCGAVTAHPEYATTAFLWSFEPSLSGRYTKRTAPGFGPNSIGCGGDVAGWQYQLSAGSTPDVDSDQVLSRIPLWYP